MNIVRTHHVAVICSDYERSKDFYVCVLGLEVVSEVYRAERDSHELDPRRPDGAQIELFSFPDPPERPSYPEACGPRRLAFEVGDIGEAVADLAGHGVVAEPVRVDPHTGKQFTFLSDPAGLPQLVARLKADANVGGMTPSCGPSRRAGSRSGAGPSRASGRLARTRSSPPRPRCPGRVIAPRFASAF